MTVQSYLFQSPYSSSVQVGRPDPSVKKEDTSQNSSLELPSAADQTLQATQTSEVKPSVDSTHLLDVYV